MNLNIPIKEGAKTKAVLKLLNPFLGNLTEKELNITTKIIDLNLDTLSSDNRSALRLNLNMGKYLFNNYIQSLKSKKILLTGPNNVLILNSSLRQMTSSPNFNITFIN
jgi:hypothetical protein